MANMLMGAFLVHQALPWRHKLLADVSAAANSCLLGKDRQHCWTPMHIDMHLNCTLRLDFPAPAGTHLYCTAALSYLLYQQILGC